MVARAETVHLNAGLYSNQATQKWKAKVQANHGRRYEGSKNNLNVK